MITYRGIAGHPGTHKHNEGILFGHRDPKPLIEEMGRQWEGTGIPTRGLARFAVTGTTFMRIRNGYRSEFLSTVLPKFPLIDLGAGYCLDMIRFASAYRIPKYTAVDRFYEYPESSANPRIAFANCDMLEFLIRQPPASGSIVMNAIDEIMLYCPNAAVREEYSALLLAYMFRTVPVGGIAFGLNSPILGELEDLGFRSIGIKERYGVPERSFILQRLE